MYKVRLYSRHPNALYKPWVFFSVLLGSFALSFMIDWILLWPPISRFVVNVLHRDVTATSRTRIYMLLPVLMRNRYLLGYGYGTTYELGIRLGGFPNTQNALWEWIWQCGIIGTALLLCIIYFIIRYADRAHKVSNDQHSKYMLILLYLFSVLATVEITIDSTFLGCLAMMIPLTYINQERINMLNTKNGMKSSKSLQPMLNWRSDI